jgi:M6 family metalloprotease-like protein
MLAAAVLALGANITTADDALSNCASPEFLAERAAAWKKASLAKKQEGAAAAPTKIVGLTIPMFSPDELNLTKEMIEEFCNRKGGIGGNTPFGSVYDYYYDVSDGLLEYTNIVAPFIAVDDFSERRDSIITRALRKTGAENLVDFSKITTSESGYAVALNILVLRRHVKGLYNAAGATPDGFATRLIGDGITIRDVKFFSYQITGMDNDNLRNMGTFVHENGHLLFGWRDMYNYVAGSTMGGGGEVRFCIMYDPNPGIMPNPYFRDLEGWLDVRPITDATSGVFSITANSPMAYKYARNEEESFYITAVRRAGRNAGIMGNGLAIWHVNTINTGTNIVKFISAGGSGIPYNEDFFSAPPSRYYGNMGCCNTSFSRYTRPAAVWHDGTPSNLNISDISEIGRTMTFKVNGASSPQAAQGSVAQLDAAAGAPFDYGISAGRLGNIAFRIPSAGRVSVRMYDVKGRMVAVLFDGVKNPGIHSVNIPPRVGKGVYFVRMESGGHIENIKVFNRL